MKDKSIKRLLLIFVVFLLMGIGTILNIPSNVVTAEASGSYTYGDFYFEVVNGYASISGYKGRSGVVQIPSTVYNGSQRYTVKYIKQYVFKGDKNIRILNIPGSVEEIGYAAFEDCTNLYSLQLSEGLKTIKDFAFHGCHNISTLSLPNSLVTLRRYSFQDCTGLTSVYIPAKVSSLSYYAFYECTSLKSINIDVNNNAYSSINGVVYDKGKTTLLICPNGFPGELTIPNGITDIGYAAFYGCAKMKRVNFPSNLKNIGEDAFSMSTGLESVTIPAYTNNLVNWCFYRCNSLKTVEIYGDVTQIDEYYFSECFSIERIIFWDKSQVSDSVVPTQFRSYEKVPFKSGSKSGIMLVKPGASKEMRTIKDSDYSINKTAGWDGYCVKVYLKGNNNLVSFDKKEFKDKIEITNNNKTNKTFFVKYSDGKIIEGGIDLSNLKIDNVMPKIDIEGDFENAKKQVSLTIKKTYGESGAKVTVSKNGHAEEAVNTDNYTVYENGVYKFKITSGSGLVSEKTVEVSNIDNPNYLTYSFNDKNNTATVTGYIGRCKYVTIPETVRMNGKTYRVTSIGNNAFKNCTSIIGVRVPDSVTTIKGYAFWGCSNLKSINIPAAVTNIYIYAFADCISLDKIEIPSSMIKVGKYAFLNCLSLKNVAMSKNTQVYDNSTFRKCYGVSFKYI